MLHALLPILMGGNIDHTKYVHNKNNESHHYNAGLVDNSSETKGVIINKNEELHFDPWIRERTFEGGYVNNKYDRGGKTNYGITQHFMEEHKDALLGGATKPIEELTEEDTKCLYFSLWNRHNLGQIRDKNLAFVLNDYMINSSDKGVATRVQQILNSNGASLEADGIFGTRTLEAINNTDSKWLIDQIIIDRYQHYRKIVNRDRSQLRFYKGWINRLNKVAEIAGSELIFSNQY